MGACAPARQRSKEEPEGGAFDLRVAVPADIKFVYSILEEMERSARARGAGAAHAIKERVFALSRERYPDASVFSITTGAAVMKMNHRLGFEPVTYDRITRDERFWDQCRQCVNHGILESTGRSKCLCTAMLYRRYPTETG